VQLDCATGIIVAGGRFSLQRCKVGMYVKDRRIVHVAVLATALKLLLIPSAFSTDFEVHRHWKALTRSLPLSEWYVDSSSPWTLDYPPLFAYMERAMAELAALVHPPIVDVFNFEYRAAPAVLFMRLSVIASDAVLLYAVLRFVAAAKSLYFSVDSQRSAHDQVRDSRYTEEQDRNPWTGAQDLELISAALVFFNPGLLLVDNMHFQYNGLVLAILLLSLSCFMKRRLCLGAAIFSVAINVKHTLLPVAPSIALYILLCTYDTSKTSKLLALKRLVRVATCTLLVFALAWAPLFAAGGSSAISHCLGRLFPFDRGLLHAYWAPNLWAVYAFIDKSAAVVGCRLRDADVDISSGLIGGRRPFVCLPNVTPYKTAILVLSSIVPALIALWSSSALPPTLWTGRKCLRSELLLPQIVAFSSLSAFVFGWHVHEKMILLATLPMAGVVLFDNSVYKESTRFACFLLIIAGTFGLFPLVSTPSDVPVKIALYLAYCLFAFPFFCFYGGDGRSQKWYSYPRIAALLRWWARPRWQLLGVYCLALFILELYAGTGGGHAALFGRERLQFVPLLLVSTISACGVLGAYALQLSILVHSLICRQWSTNNVEN
jgi:alpha-1,3-glucosyltransferase